MRVIFVQRLRIILIAIRNLTSVYKKYIESQSSNKFTSLVAGFFILKELSKNL